MGIQQEKMTDTEVADVAKLLDEVQNKIYEGKYPAGVVFNVMTNIAARYAARIGLKRRDFRKATEDIFIVQEKQHRQAVEKKAAAEAEAADPEN